MSDDDEESSYARPLRHPGAVRATLMVAAEKLADHDVAAAPPAFYETPAGRAEEISDEAIAEAIDARDDGTVIESVRITRRLLHALGDELFLATEQAADATLARLAAYLLLEGNDTYGATVYRHAWGACSDPEWGTIWGIHQAIRDLTPTFIFKVCMKGDVRLLGVECHAPRRRLPDDPHARVRARTMIVSGIPVLAFSPAEVDAGAKACAAEICDALGVLAQELLALRGMEPPPRYDFRPRAEM
jgi:hypothetical protein